MMGCQSPRHTRQNKLILLNGKNSGMAYNGRGYKQGRVLHSKIMTTPGDLTPTLHTMMAVSLSRLKLGQNFPERDIITLRVAEEANYRGILFHTNKSNAMKMYCRGPGSILYMQ
jgi:hypothetical protein